VNVTVGAPTTVARLFIANFVGNNITSYANPGSINGNIAPDTNLSGANTQLANPADIVVGASGALLVSNFDGGTPSVTTYVNANTASGNVTPSGNVQGGNTQLIGGPTSLAVNTTSDLLFVSKLGAAPAILTFASVSTAGFTGNMAPARTITTTGVLTSPFGINLDKNGNLYVANNATATILVYANAANLNGNIAPTRTITGNPAFTGLFDVYVDASDRMYVVNSIGARINVYNNASALNGAVAPDFTLTVQGGGTLTSIAVDSAGRGYITEEAPLPGRILSYDNIATRNGTLAPDRTITGTNTQLNAPIRVFLEE
jgi:sugar lactone lactonase YvrE